eukprot:SAG11_NODE_415_length_9675_cov_2.425961_4_plen_91_part_00
MWKAHSRNATWLNTFLQWPSISSRLLFWLGPAAVEGGVDGWLYCEWETSYRVLYDGGAVVATPVLLLQPTSDEKYTVQGRRTTGSQRVLA